MIRQFGHFRRALAARKMIAFMLAFWLNFALLPCAMALQTSATDHDCCPPTLELAAEDCCELDDYSIDHRDGKDIGDFVGIVEHRLHPPTARHVVRRTALPPDPDDAAPPLYVRHCVYLK